MPDAFFTSSKTRKRKRTLPSQGAGPSAYKARNSQNKTKTTKKRRVDEELSDQTHSDDGDGGVEDMDLRINYEEENAVSDEEDPDETPAEKRLRLAQVYLDSVKEDVTRLADGEFDAAEIDRELISSRLKQDVLEHAGKMHLFIADSFDFTQHPKSVLRTRGHRFSVTSAVASNDFLFTAGKEGSIIKWDLASGKKLATFYKVKPIGKGKGKAAATAITGGHSDEVLALAVSDDGKYLASGGRDRKVCVWDAAKGGWITSFSGHLGHKDLISALSFRRASHTLYSGSFDRTIKSYDLTPSVMGYVETLFGHQDHIMAVHALKGETCVSVGARDKTVRFWKIVDETQLVFRGGGRSRIREVLDGGLRGDGDDEDDETDQKNKTTKFVEGSLESVAMIDETTFVSGGDSGSLCLWNTQKKKPLFTQPLSHGVDSIHSEAAGVVQNPRWVTAVASLPYSDLFASASWDGNIRLWAIDKSLKSFSAVGSIAVPGVINSLQLISPLADGAMDRASWAEETRSTGHDRTKAQVLLIAGIGQEHRLGRWIQLKDGVSNGAMIFVLPR